MSQAIALKEMLEEYLGAENVLEVRVQETIDQCLYSATAEAVVTRTDEAEKLCDAWRNDNAILRDWKAVQVRFCVEKKRATVRMDFAWMGVQ